ncbi:MAG: hypothetical protein J4N71_08835 [Chloroflexi bacterium]|nr:hypothetical protein [Chloroflexota bacterium]
MKAHQFEPDQAREVYNENGVKLTAFPVPHGIYGAVGYRLDYGGLSMVFAGDCEPSTITVENPQNVNVTPEQIVTRMVEFEPGPFLVSDPEYMAGKGGAQPDPSVMHGLPEWLEKTTIGIPMIDEFKKELAARGMR